MPSLPDESSGPRPRCLDIELAALKRVRAQLDRHFDRAVELAVQTLARRGKIVVLGIGKSGAIGRKIAATLTSTGSTSVVLDSVDALHGDLGIVADGDLIIALSYSGESEELVNLMRVEAFSGENNRRHRRDQSSWPATAMSSST